MFLAPASLAKQKQDIEAAFHIVMDGYLQASAQRTSSTKFAFEELFEVLRSHLICLHIILYIFTGF